MGNIEKVSRIKRESLSDQHYFQSLLEGAYGEKLLSEGELEQIQLDCLALLAKKTQQFTGGESGSIPVEAAQGILASLLFTIGVALKAYSSPDEAVAAVQRRGVEAICAEGRKRIDRLLGQAKLGHKALTRHLLESKNVFYSSTVVDGINGFFKLYDPAFAAQEIHITADYPVYNKAPQLLGIEFILQYLNQLHYENQFCIAFSQEDIHHLLCGHDPHYENLLLNLYEPVLAAALGRVLADVPPRTLEITPQLQAFLSHQMKGKGQGEIRELLERALVKLGAIFSFSDGLLAYVGQSLPQLALTIESGEKTGMLQRVFLCPAYPEAHPRLTISYGEKMEDGQYRRVLALFMKSGSMSEKINILKSQIHSLGDLEDLLLDAQLNEEEMTRVLSSLSPAEIVALLKKARLSYEGSFPALREEEKVLWNGLDALVASLPPGQRELLEKAVNALEGV